MQPGPKSRVGYPVAVGLIAAAALITYPTFHYLDFVVGAMAMLLIVLYISIGFGMGPAILAAILSSLYLNFFFVGPPLELDIGSGPDMIALIGFMVTAVVVGRLSQNAAQRAREAERGREEIERLYGELQLAFEKTSTLEAIKRSEQMKSALLDAVTHDLRTPLTSIKAAATTLSKGIFPNAEITPLSEDLRFELINVVVEETDRLNHFIDELLVLAKIQGGNVDIKEPPGRIEDVASAATQRASKLLKDYRLTVNVASCDAEIELANPRIAAQALYGLLENAAKYSPVGSQITVSVSVEDQNATFSVDDEGPGVPESDRELIFSRFYRRQHPSTAASPGLGMGLAIARGLVGAVGGTIAVVDKPGAGTRFAFSVPLFKASTGQDSKHV
jgi:K+-sensing histidine kinase KdpD